MRNADNKGIAHTKRTMTISYLLAIPLISRPAFREHLNLVEPIGNKAPNLAVLCIDRMLHPAGTLTDLTCENAARSFP